MTEAQLQTVVVGLARMLRFLVYHTRDSRGSDKGFPDLVMVRERTIYVELKSEKGKLTPEQREWIAALKAAGEEVYVWRPAEWMDGTIERVLTGGK